MVALAIHGKGVISAGIREAVTIWFAVITEEGYGSAVAYVKLGRAYFFKRKVTVF